MNSVLLTGARSLTSRLSYPSKPWIYGLARTINKPATYSRTFWHMCSVDSGNESFLKPQPLGQLCRCGCSGLLHTRGESDLVDFLKQEIVAERKNQKIKSLPASFDGFALETDQADVKLIKRNQVGNQAVETIIVSFNVNHTVDTEETDELAEDGSYSGDMKAKPAFEIDIVKENSTLRFGCSFSEYTSAGDEANLDNFQIDDVTFFEGEWNEKIYAVSGDVLDANLYDLFMTVLNEKGITPEFVDKVEEIATAHEHLQYIGLLEKVQKFVSVN